jgi:16S rRNA (guanine966-N2)-methyltransferase
VLHGGRDFIRVPSRLGTKMRVIGGKYRSRRLQSMSGMDLRPTADRLRETLFDVLTAGNASALERSMWIDLCAGTGAVGIEAISRGAGMVYFIDSSARAVSLIRKNLESLEVQGGFQVLAKSSLRGLQELEAAGIPADYVFLDPPYRMEAEYESILSALSRSPLLGPTSRVIAEHHKKFDPGQSFGRLERYRKLEQGDAVLSFYRTT